MQLAHHLPHRSIDRTTVPSGAARKRNMRPATVQSSPKSNRGTTISQSVHGCQRGGWHSPLGQPSLPGRPDFSSKFECPMGPRVVGRREFLILSFLIPVSDCWSMGTVNLAVAGAGWDGLRADLRIHQAHVTSCQTSREWARNIRLLADRSRWRPTRKKF